MQANSVLYKGEKKHSVSLTFVALGCVSITLGIILLPHNITSLDERKVQSQEYFLKSTKSGGKFTVKLLIRFLDLYVLTSQYSTEQRSYN